MGMIEWLYCGAEEVSRVLNLKYSATYPLSHLLLTPFGERYGHHVISRQNEYNMLEGR